MSRLNFRLIACLALFAIVAALAVLTLNAASPAAALTPPSITPVSSLGGSVACVAVSGTVAYVWQGETLVSLDIRDAGKINRLASLTLPGSCARIKISGTTAYIANGYGGLQIVDVSDPFHLKWLGSYTTSAGVRDVAVAGNRAYAVADALEILDVSNPAQPVLLGSYSQLPSDVLNAVDVAGQYAYVASSLALTVVDVAVPAHPVKVASLSPGYPCYRVKVSGNLLVLMRAQGNVYYLDTFDISAPSALVRVWGVGYQVGSVPANNCCALDVAGNYAYMTGLQLGVAVFAIGNPPPPGFFTNTSYTATDITVVGSRVYLADSEPTASGRADGHLRIVDFDSSFNFTQVGTYYEFGMISDVEARAPYLYTGDDLREFQVVDATDPTAPAMVYTTLDNGSGRHVKVIGSRAYVNMVKLGIDIFDITNPTHPAFLGRYNPTGHGLYDVMTTDGNYVYLIERNAGLKIVDVHDPANPNLVGTLGGSSLQGAATLHVAGNILYAGAGALVTVDISNPAQPRLLGTASVNGAYAIDVVSSLAFVAAVDGVYIFDVSNPAMPTPYGKYSLANAQRYDIKVTGNLAYTADVSGMTIVDVSDARNPVLYLRYNLPCALAALDVAGDLIFGACTNGGLKTLRLNSGVPTAIALSSLAARANAEPGMLGWLVALATVCAIGVGARWVCRKSWQQKTTSIRPDRHPL